MNNMKTWMRKLNEWSFFSLQSHPLNSRVSSAHAHKIKDADHMMGDQPTNPKVNDERTSSVRSLITDFCGYTSAVGPGRIHEGKNKIQKIIWVLLFVGAIAAFGVQIAALYEKFQERPLTTHVKVIHDTVRWSPGEGGGGRWEVGRWEVVVVGGGGGGGGVGSHV